MQHQILLLHVAIHPSHNFIHERHENGLLSCTLYNARVALRYAAVLVLFTDTLLGLHLVSQYL